LSRPIFGRWLLADDSSASYGSASCAQGRAERSFTFREMSIAESLRKQ
jgi:hypothetical protein